MTSFIYSNPADIMRAQEVFIDIGNHMLHFCEFVNEFMKERYYKILKSLLFRGELDLAQMKFQPEDEQNLKHMQAKRKLASAY